MNGDGIFDGYADEVAGFDLEGAETVSVDVRDVFGGEAEKRWGGGVLGDAGGNEEDGAVVCGRGAQV